MRPAVAVFACLFAAPATICADDARFNEEVITAVKRATVFVQVQGPDWKGSGSGFVVKSTKDTLLVATNYHVLAGSNADRRVRPTEANRIARAAKVNLVFDSGAKGERTAKAEVVAIDPDVDLAILRVTGLNDPPTPISLTSPKLIETMAVYSLGFPFGKALAVGQASPAVTVGKAAISSLRFGDDGELSVIQIDGNLHPGNSGGPIVNEKGELVGIAVAKIRDGQGIGFAVPYAELNRVLGGGVGRPQLAALPGVGGKVTVKVEIGVIDPDSSIGDVSLHYVVVAPEAKKPAAKDRLDKFAGAKRIPLKVDGSVATAEIALENPAGEVFVQAVPQGRDGKGLSLVRSMDLTAPALLAAGKLPAGWKEFVAKDHEFSVWVPDRAMRQLEQDRTVVVRGLRIRSTSLRVELANGLTYTTDHLSVPRALSNRLKREELEEGFREWVESEVNGKLVEDIEVQLGTTAGREFRIESAGRVCRARLFVIGDGKVLVLQVAGPAAEMKGPASSMFLNSCRLSPVMARKSPQVAPAVPMVPPARATDLPRLPAVSIPSKTIEKIKLPPAADREKATRLARDLFKDEFAMTNSAAKTEFANRLYQQAGETDDDPASQFVLYRESAEIAATLDMDLALRACEAIAGRFEGSTAEVLEPILAAIADKVTRPEAASELAVFVMKRIEDALAIDDVETAGRLHKIAQQCSGRSKNIKIARQSQSIAGDIEFLKSMLDKVRAAQSTAKSNPNDAQANLILGKYACFLKGDWKTGLPMLAKSSDEKLKQIAAKEIEAGEDDRQAASGIGDAWYELLGSLKDYPKTRVQLHVHSLYSKAFPVATGLTKAKIEKRLDELDTVLAGRFEHAALWPLVRAALRDRTYDKTQIMGGAFGANDYSEIPVDGGILIGFNYTLKPAFGKEEICCFQPIYLTPSGERLGAVHGDLNSGKVFTVKAKANYAIGKMAMRNGGLWGGAKLVFMRIDGKALKPSDSYESEWVGFNDHPSPPFLGDGRPIIGIFGKNQRDDVGICSIGFYVVGEKPAESK